jgi:hypothetical protein
VTENERAFFNQSVDAVKQVLVSVAAAIPPTHAIGRTALDVIIQGVDGLKFSNLEPAALSVAIHQNEDAP